MPSGHKPTKRGINNFINASWIEANYVIIYEDYSIQNNADQHIITCTDEVCPVVAEEVGEVQKGGLRIIQTWSK